MCHGMRLVLPPLAAGAGRSPGPSFPPAGGCKLGRVCVLFFPGKPEKPGGRGRGRGEGGKGERVDTNYENGATSQNETNRFVSMHLGPLLKNSFSVAPFIFPTFLVAAKS